MNIRHKRWSGGRPMANLLRSAALLSVAAGGPVFAQETPAARETDDEVIVVTGAKYVVDVTSSTKTNTPLVEVPQSISIVSRDRIELLGWNKVEQALRYVSGVVSESFGPDERFSNSRVRAFEPEQYIDGVQSPVGVTKSTGIDLYLFETIEVLKGPNSTLYGAVPPGGILNLVSRRPQDEFGGELRARGGSFRHLEGAFDVTGPVDDHVSFRVTGLYYDQKHQVRFVQTDRLLVAPAVTLEISPDTRLTLLSHYQLDHHDGGSSLQFLPIFGTRLPNPNGGRLSRRSNFSEPGYDTYRAFQYDFGYGLSHGFSDAFSIHQVVKYGKFGSDLRGTFGRGLATNNRTLTRGSFHSFPRVDRLAVDTRLEGKLRTGSISQTLVLGTDYRDLTDLQRSGANLTGAPSIDIYAPVYGLGTVATPTLTTQRRQTQKQIGIYAQDQVKLGRLVVTVGGRYDWVRDRVDDLRTTLPDVKRKTEAGSFRGGINYVFDNGIAPYIGYAKSFQPLFGATFEGTAFEPTRGKQLEAGIKYDARGLPRGIQAFASAAVYDLRQTNVTTPDTTPGRPPGFSVQTGEVGVRGFEFEAVARFHERFSLNAAFTYSDTETLKTNTANQLGKRLTLVPKVAASLFADYTFQDGFLAGFGLGAGVRHTGRNFGDRPNLFANPAVTLFDAVAHYHTGQWRFDLNANNVFDKVYVASCSSNIQCFYGSARTIYLSVAYKL